MTSGVVMGAIILWVVPVFVARSMGKAKRRSGVAYGLFLGWLGVVILALLPAVQEPVTYVCPYCAEPIRREAIVCRHCGRDLAPATD